MLGREQWEAEDATNELGSWAVNDGGTPGDASDDSYDYDANGDGVVDFLIPVASGGGVSSDASNSLTLGADGLPFFEHVPSLPTTVTDGQLIVGPPNDGVSDPVAPQSGDSYVDDNGDLWIFDGTGWFYFSTSGGTVEGVSTSNQVGNDYTLGAGPAAGPGTPVSRGHAYGDL